MKKYTQDEVNEILQLHKMWLNNKEGGKRADLRRADLEGANLRGADLREANLREADLREANLRGANLRRADLEGADLEGADLEGADLREANLRGANLRRANFWGADLREANLRGANLRGADLEGADLRRADLEGADLSYNIPKIKNIHQKILEAVTANTLNMDGWHTCATTHCHAGWAVHLAGAAGYELEKKTTTLLAAKLIFQESSLIKMKDEWFFMTKTKALNKIKELAELEKQQQQ